MGFLNCKYSLIQAWLIFLVIGLKRCKHLFSIKNFQVPTKRIYNKPVTFMFMRKSKATRLPILFQIFINNKSLNFTFSISFKKNITTVHKRKVLKDSNQSLQIYLSKKLFIMVVLKPQDNFMMTTFCKFQSENLETFLENKLSTHSHFSNCFLSFYGKNFINLKDAW